ncbi:MAG: hypothetical protein ACHQ4H_02410 [Ktedonobacterales bacterium]
MYQFETVTLMTAPGRKPLAGDATFTTGAGAAVAVGWFALVTVKVSFEKAVGPAPFCGAAHSQ